jgi:hypothetical protein
MVGWGVFWDAIFCERRTSQKSGTLGRTHSDTLFPTPVVPQNLLRQGKRRGLA